MPRKVQKKSKVVVGECLTCGWNTKMEVESDNFSFAKFEVEKALENHCAENSHTQSKVRVFERTKAEKESTELEKQMRGIRKAEEHKNEREQNARKILNVFMKEELNQLNSKQNKAVLESKEEGEWTEEAKAFIGNRKLKKLEKYGFLDN